MRLINIDTLKLESFLGTVPPYAILSHTWGNEEITLQDVLTGQVNGSQAGWKKVVEFCQNIKKHDPGRVSYAWVDTCCIDKTSSAELGEAINAMFQWYRDAEFCYAFLDDYDYQSNQTAAQSPDFQNCRWFTRGWTLQELLAPVDVHFFDKAWTPLGTKISLVTTISARTGINEDCLLTNRWPNISIAQKMSWAAGRKTTRIEDIAYSLMGILDVNMPLLYGEGGRAFIRLQEEVIKEFDDSSIFAWDASLIPQGIDMIGALAPSPVYFQACNDIEPNGISWGAFSVTNKGVQIELPILHQNHKPLAILACSKHGHVGSAAGILLEKDERDSSKYYRRRSDVAHLAIGNHGFHAQSIYLMKRSESGGASRNIISSCWLQVHVEQIALVSIVSPIAWHSDKNSPSWSQRIPSVSLPIINSVVQLEVIESKTKFWAVLDLDVRNGGGSVQLSLEEPPQQTQTSPNSVQALIPKGSERLEVILGSTPVIGEITREEIRGSWTSVVNIRTTV